MENIPKVAMVVINNNVMANNWRVVINNKITFHGLKKITAKCKRNKHYHYGVILK